MDNKLNTSSQEEVNVIEIDIWQLIKQSFKKYSMYYFLAGIMIAFQILTQGVLLQPLNITNIILQNSYILILAIGMLMVIVMGDIDLSVGSVAAFIGAISAIFIIKMDIPVILAVILSLAIGAAIGAFQGFWIAYVKVPAFIATLAGMLIFRGLTIAVLDGKSVAPFPASYQSMSSGFIPDLFNGSHLNLFTLFIAMVIIAFLIFMQVSARRKKIANAVPVEANYIFVAKMIAMTVAVGWFSWIMAAYEGFPNVLIILAVLIMGYRFMTARTTLGRQMYATGGNEKAAILSGINTKKIRFLMFVNMGVLAAVAGLVFSARLNAATAAAGNGFELDAIAAAFIGGASAYGGIGTVLGTIIGGLVMGVLNNGMSLMGIGADWQQAIKGIVLLLAVAFDVYSKNKKG